MAAAGAPAASAGARVAFEGSASAQEAQVAITLSALPLQALAPYVAQAVVPRVDGRVDARGSLTWSAKADAPALRLAVLV